ncbi:MAG: sulfotransferase domain-containing protein [Cephaloticoccus sp.]|nr:sulfotransferase domain-containing protein [Cephaloticoccus sp.]MCF7760770.1 sulfotransferase domain-containing protein [Cephaloticoccus sp.]
MSDILPPNSFYVVSFPRSGNTWLINCLTMLLDGVRGEAYTPFKLYTELHGEVEEGFHFWCEPRQSPNQPICIKSHDDLDRFRSRHAQGPIIYIARDARDCLLSYYFFKQAYAGGEELGTEHIQGTSVLVSRGGTEPVFNRQAFADFIRSEAENWVSHISSAKKTRGICYLTYEELKVNFIPTLTRVTDYLQLPVRQSCNEVQKVYDTGFGKIFAGNKRDFFRQGRSGDWKNWFDKEHAILLNQLIGRELIQHGFEQNPLWADTFNP